MTADIQRQIDVHDRRLNEHGEQIDTLKIWQAKVQGFLLALTIFASLPTIILAWLALGGQVR